MKSSINKFVVVLDEPNRVFFPGHHVQGKVVLDVKQEIKLWKLNLESFGEVYVSWPEYNGTYTRYRYGREELFHLKASMYGADTEDNSKGKKTSHYVLKPSVYSFSFRFTIPSDVLPPSCEAKHGYVRYWMQANIEKKKGASELKTSQTVFAIGGYNEYDDEELAELQDYSLKFPNARQKKTSTRGSCCSAGESITLSAHTNKLIYHPSEVIKTSVTTDNEAYRAGIVRGIEASLVSLTVYDDGKNNTTNSKQEVVRAEKEVGDAREDLELVLPAKSLYPTMVRGCKNIQFAYYVKVQLKTDRKMQRAPMLMIPVAIVPPPAQPSARPPTHSNFDFQKDNVHPNSVSNNTPGILFYVTGRRHENECHISAGPPHEQHPSRRTPRETTLNNSTSGDFYFKDKPCVSYV